MVMVLGLLTTPPPLPNRTSWPQDVETVVKVSKDPPRQHPQWNTHAIVPVAE